MRRLLPLLLIACAAPDPGAVRIIGHGGSGTEGEHPMNSRMALLSGLEQGLDGIELDVQLTADSVLVAYHSEDLSDLTECKGKMNGSTWEALRYCPNTTSLEPYPIVRLDSALGELAGRFPNADFTLDCKLFAEGEWWAYMRAFADAIARLDEQPALRGRIVVECRITDFLDLVEEEQPDIPTFLYATEYSALVDSAIAHHCSGITIGNDLITAAEVREAQARGVAVTLFGVGGTLGHNDALGKKPDRLQTDAPAAFAK